MAAEPEARAPHAAGNGGATPDTDELVAGRAASATRPAGRGAPPRAHQHHGRLCFNRQSLGKTSAMLRILADYEDDRSRLARQTERLDNSRRALLHILKDSTSRT